MSATSAAPASASAPAPALAPDTLMAEAPSYSDALRTGLPAARASPVVGPVAGPSAGAPGATTATERERMLRAYIAELEREAREQEQEQTQRQVQQMWQTWCRIQTLKSNCCIRSSSQAGGARGSQTVAGRWRLTSPVVSSVIHS